MRKSLCDEFGLYDKLGFYGDGAYDGLMLQTEKFVTIDEELYNYRVGHNSTSGGGFKGKVSWYKHVAETTREQKLFLKGTKYEETLSEYFDYRYIYTLISLCCVAGINSDREAYKYAQKELLRLNYRKNNLLNTILTDNYGKLKAFVLGYIIPVNYYLACIITKLVMR